MDPFSLYVIEVSQGNDLVFICVKCIHSDKHKNVPVIFSKMHGTTEDEYIHKYINHL